MSGEEYSLFPPVPVADVGTAEIGRLEATPSPTAASTC